MEEEDCVCPTGAPGWIVTFADLMSLLLTFFILLLSFAEMDVKKYKKAAGSIQQALGVDADLILENMASSNMALKDSYGKGSNSMAEMEFSEPKIALEVETLCEMEKVRKTREVQELRFRSAQLTTKLESVLRPYINKNLIQLISDDQRIILRLNQSSSFLPNSPRLKELAKQAVVSAIPILMEQKPEIHIQTYTPKEYKDDQEKLSEWLQSMNRSAFISYVLSNTEYPQEKIKIYSQTNNSTRDPASVQEKLPGYVDLNLVLKFD